MIFESAPWKDQGDLHMKKIINDPAKYVTEMLEGLCAAHPEYYQQVGPQGRIIVRPEAPIAGKVGIVTGVARDTSRSLPVMSAKVCWMRLLLVTYFVHPQLSR